MGIPNHQRFPYRYDEESGLPLCRVCGKRLYGKYIIERADGKPMKPGFRFVLSPENDPAALEALKAYAKATSNKELAKDLSEVIARIEGEDEEK